jgi:DNA-binding YbaB/EbfC family protein
MSFFLGDMFKNLKNMKGTIANLKESLTQKRIIASSGADLVKVIADGNGQALSIEIDDSVFQEERKILNGLLLAVINDLQAKVGTEKKAFFTEQLKAMGMPIDSLDLPF